MFTFERWPTVLYGLNLLMCGVAFMVLQRALIRRQGQDGPLARATAADFKGKVSPVLYVAGVVLAMTWTAPAGLAFFVFVALIWLVPDRRMERFVSGNDG